MLEQTVSGMPRARGRVGVVATVMMLWLAGCSAGDGATTTTTTAPTDSSSTSPPTTVVTTTAPPAVTTTVAEQTTTTVADSTLRFEFVVDSGVVDGPQRVEVPLGSVVELTVMSDVADELHLHGYDLSLDLVAGVPGVLTLTAEIPGIFEMELESSRLLVTELEVAP